MTPRPLRTGSPTSASSTLTAQLLDALGREVVAGTYGTQNFPTEADISLAYATSRSVTREAIKMLTAKGLLSARPRSGIVVRPEQSWSLLDPDVLRWMLERKFSHRLLRSFTEMRQGIEPMAAKLAAQQGDTEAIGKIEQALQRMIAAGRGEDDHLSSDVAFHVAILDATGNPFYMQFHELVNTALTFSIQFTNRVRGHTASIPAHRRVLHAIKRGDADTAQAAMFAIIHDVLRLIDREQQRQAKTTRR
ncbi:FadR/GntR family transcriptional regulator [Xanthomonas maliensis]|nr:FadR/GntR family transcriptional regulator [Xanthomonas maliensis]KAB7764434.1 FadR family transcriptional regulator [Xanthomonas maliensis]